MTWIEGVGFWSGLPLQEVHKVGLFCREFFVGRDDRLKESDSVTKWVVWGRVSTAAGRLTAIVVYPIRAGGATVSVLSVGFFEDPVLDRLGSQGSYRPSHFNLHLRLCPVTLNAFLAAHRASLLFGSQSGHRLAAAFTGKLKWKLHGWCI